MTRTVPVIVGLALLICGCVGASAGNGGTAPSRLNLTGHFIATRPVTIVDTRSSMDVTLAEATVAVFAPFSPTGQPIEFIVDGRPCAFEVSQTEYYEVTLERRPVSLAPTGGQAEADFANLSGFVLSACEKLKFEAPGS